METINHECYVSPEVAKLLKKAGFDWECDKIYYCYHEDNDTWDLESNNKNHLRILELDYCLLAPSLAVAQKWLREVKNIFIEVTRYETIHPLARELFETVYDKTVDQSFAYGVNVLDANNESIYDEDCFLTYEHAQEAGIRKTLELILEE